MNHNTAEEQAEIVTTPDEAITLPSYVPTIEETIKASGGHRQAV